MLLVLCAAALVHCTLQSLRPLPLRLAAEGVTRAQILDRNGLPLAVSYSDELRADTLPLHSFPPLLRTAVITAEDKRFMSHLGFDVAARLSATATNLQARAIVRGARTIPEQVVRILHPRPSSLWTRWLETIEAVQLSARFSKLQILEFYLNQVPYSHQRRGAAAAARLYFKRDLHTLSPEEMLGLAVLIRAPGRLAKESQVEALQRAVSQLAARLIAQGALTEAQYQRFTGLQPTPTGDTTVVEASHFVRFARVQLGALGSTAAVRARKAEPASTGTTTDFASVVTTIDATLQQAAQRYLDSRLADLQKHRVHHAGALIVDHQTSEILAWVNAGRAHRSLRRSDYDTVRTLRQPGSTLKPFLYAQALESGWTAATVIDDRPLHQALRGGVHQYQNYSRIHYGPLRLRETLGNSLNIPAVLAMRHVGPEQFLTLLHQLQFDSLNGSIAEYGEGLALGNAEVSLYELVRAYATIARGGYYRPLRHFLSIAEPDLGYQVFAPSTAAIIADILADRQARKKEFGASGVLSLPYPTAVKTGTSNDFRDSWAIGFSDRYTVGVWMGNLDRRSTDEISGARGPALVLRGLFQKLRSRQPARPLAMPRDLQAAQICELSGKRAATSCPLTSEWFTAATVPTEECDQQHEHPHQATARAGLRLLLPTPGLRLAEDPRIEDQLEAFAFELSAHPQIQQVDWLVDEQVVGTTGHGVYRWLWPLQRGTHTVAARVHLPGQVRELPPVSFSVR